MNDNFEKMFLDVINGKKSVRECEEVYGIDRNTFVKKCKERFPEGSEQRKKLETILSHNKGEFQKRDLDMERLKEAVNALLNGKIKTVTEAKDVVSKDMDLQTFQEHLLDFINGSNDNELKRKYIAYEAQKYPNYSHINFIALFIEMIKKQESQSEMARRLGIPSRTISRELEKLQDNEEYRDIYEIEKELSRRKKKHGRAKNYIPFDELEMKKIEVVLDKYNEGPIIIGNQISEVDNKYEKAKKLMEDVNGLGKSQKDAAKELGISISTIRRAIKTVESYEGIRKKEEPDVEER